MVHLYDLSRVETPPESRKHRSRGLSQSRGRSILFLPLCKNLSFERYLQFPSRKHIVQTISENTTTEIVGPTNHSPTIIN